MNKFWIIFDMATEALSVMALLATVGLSVAFIFYVFFGMLPGLIMG